MEEDKSKGVYKTNGDTIYLIFQPLRGDSTYENGKLYVFYPEALSATNRPDTLFYKKDKLYRIEDGLIINRTKRSPANFIKTKGWRKYFRRQYYFMGQYILKKRKIYYLRKIEEVK